MGLRLRRASSSTLFGELFTSAQQKVQNHPDYWQEDDQEAPQDLLIRIHVPLDAINDCDDVQHKNDKPKDSTKIWHIPSFFYITNVIF
jgi:hypothetical protein